MKVDMSVQSREEGDRAPHEEMTAPAAAAALSEASTPYGSLSPFCIALHSLNTLTAVHPCELIFKCFQCRHTSTQSNTQHNATKDAQNIQRKKQVYIRFMSLLLFLFIFDSIPCCYGFSFIIHFDW